MNKAISMSIAAAAALALSGGVYAQSHNTLATPSVTSPVAAPTSGYGTPGATGSDSGMSTGSQNSHQQKNMSTTTPGGNAYGTHNTLATPSVASPAGQ